MLYGVALYTDPNLIQADILREGIIRSPEKNPDNTA